MDHLPLTRPAPFVEFSPSGMDPLFDELAPLVRAPFAVTVTAGGEGGRRCLMDLLVAEGDVMQAFALAFEQGSDLEDFEIAVRRRKS